MTLNYHISHRVFKCSKLLYDWFNFTLVHLENCKFYVLHDWVTFQLHHLNYEHQLNTFLGIVDPDKFLLYMYYWK
jgi:hypothetical protein